jgi:predicted mannosyl-3-phosphoglycerate phosphatase (HAD superfamily)
MHVYIDQDTGEWVLELDQPGNPIIRTATKRAMEAVLDYMDNVGVQMEAELDACRGSYER